MLMHEDMPRGCLRYAWHGIEAQTEHVCKTHTRWSKYDSYDQTRPTSKIGTQLSPKQHRTVT